MEPDREELQKALEPGAAAKRKRFRIVKLEERIAPTRTLTKGHQCYTQGACTNKCSARSTCWCSY